MVIAVAVLIIISVIYGLEGAWADDRYERNIPNDSAGKNKSSNVERAPYIAPANKDVVVVKNRIWWSIIYFGTPLLFPILLRVVATIKENIPDKANSAPVIMLSLVFIGIGILGFSWTFNHRVIFDNCGITVKHKIRILILNIFDKSTTIPWNTIDHVSFDICSGGGTSVFRFYYCTNEGKRSYVFLSYLQHKNYVEGLEYAVTKLPPEKINGEAWQALRECGIAFPKRPNPQDTTKVKTFKNKKRQRNKPPTS